MPKRIKSLKVLEGSLVDNPANVGARVLLYKRKARDGRSADLAKEARTFEEMMAERRAEEEIDDAMRGVHESVWALRQSITSILADEDVKNTGEMIDQSVAQFRSAMAARLEQLGKKDDAMATKDELQEQLDQLTEQVGDLTKQVGDLTKQNADLEKRATEAEEKRDSLQKEADELKKAAGKPDGGGGGQDDEEMLKSLPKALRLEIEDMRKRDKEREEAVSKLQLEREEEQSIGKVEREWPSIGKAYKLGPVYRKITKALDEDELKELERVFKEHGELSRIAQSAMGRSGHGASTVDAEIEAKVAEVRKADPKMTEAAARSKVWSENPDLVRRHREETPQH